MMISGMTATNRFKAITMARCLPSILLNRRTDSSGNATHGRFSNLSWYARSFSRYRRAVEAHLESLDGRPSPGSVTLPPPGPAWVLAVQSSYGTHDVQAARRPLY